MHKLSNSNNPNIAIRFSELESLESILLMKNKIKWVWVDCFTKNPLTFITYIKLKNAGFKLCFVSPELQNQGNKIEIYRDYFKDNNINLDMICCKIYNINRWN